MPVPDSILYLTESDVEQSMTIGLAVDLAEKGIKADGAGNVVGDKFYMSVGAHGFIKPFSGYIEGEEWAYVKTFSFFGQNPERFGVGTTSSMIMLFDAETGLPGCIMEGAWITAVKTGASSAITAAYLARPDSNTVTIFGAGMLGRTHLLALTHRFDLAKAFVLDVLPEVAEKYAADLQPEVDFPIEVVPLDNRERAVREADIVLTVTTGNRPVVERAWLQPGTFVARLGSYQEVTLDVITQADKVVVDSWFYVSPRVPEVVMLVEQGRFAEEDLHALWPDIVAGRRPGRESAEEVIVYMALGIWGEYAAILPEVYRQARAKGLGRVVP